MKKILAALAIAAFASSASALVANSSHDFTTNTGFLTVTPVHACKGCHTAHGATMSSNLIWARTPYTGLTVTVYSGGGTVDPKGVLACLSCHSTNAASTLAKPLATIELGTDLGNTHPVGSGFTVGVAPDFQTTITLGGVTVASGTAMMCSTCHTVHNASAAPARYLLKAYAPATNICVACHNK